jgi:ATP-binding cassette subfamily B protein
MSLTQDLVASMVGHRTRQVQQPLRSWHEEEDRSLEAYYHDSASIDRIGCVLVAAAPRGWLVLGLCCLAKGVVTGHAAGAQTAVLLGGILLAWNAFERLAGSLTEVTGAWIGWKRIGYLFRAASRKQNPGVLIPGKKEHTLIEADRLSFRHRPHGPAVLDNCALTVRSGERILLEGPSGGGKTTLASVLAGARKPDAGLVLAGGLDMEILGRDGWRDYAVLVPQFHENHILTETLAFNVLCGRAWPPSHADLAEADEVCRGLGLGPLIDRMPAGLMQMLGEGGWQLSHGERSRIFIARALLQAPALTILDESFGALDPENLRSALEFTRERADALMVIAHP